MELAIVGLIGAATAGVVRGGSLARLTIIRLRATWLVVLSLAIQIYFVVWPPDSLTREIALAIYLGSQGLLIGFILLNRRLQGVLLVGVGLAMNLCVIGLNQAMPVSEPAARVAGAEFVTDHRHAEHGLHLRNEPLTGTSKLPWLSDVIPAPLFEQVMSVGDLIMSLGLIHLVYGQVVGDQERRRKAWAPIPVRKTSGN
jgi:Family of unknown function (DUF5317)